MVLDLDSDSDGKQNLERIRIRAWTQYHAMYSTSAAPRVLHPRTANRILGSAQSMASSNANGGASPRTKPQSSTTTTTPTAPASASTAIGFRDPLVARREESEAHAKAAPPLRSSLGSLVHQLLAHFLAFFGLYCNLIVFFSFLKDYRARALRTPTALSASFHLFIALHTFLRACVRVCPSRNWMHDIHKVLFSLIFCWRPLLYRTPVWKLTTVVLTG